MLQAQAQARPHVYAADQGLHLQNETVEAIFWDDAALLLLVIKGGVVGGYTNLMVTRFATVYLSLSWLLHGPPPWFRQLPSASVAVSACVPVISVVPCAM